MMEYKITLRDDVPAMVPTTIVCEGARILDGGAMLFYGPKDFHLVMSPQAYVTIQQFPFKEFGES